MTQQELADASGVSLRTISSFEDPKSDRQPTPANLETVRRALERLGVTFTAAGVEWVPRFSAPQIKAINALAVRKGQNMCTPRELVEESGCSRGELEALVSLGIVQSLDTSPLLTAIGHHIPGLLRAYEDKEAQRSVTYAPINYSIHPADGTVFHARLAASYRIKDDGDVSPLFDQYVPEGDRSAALAGAREALRQHRERDPGIVGQFKWYV